MIIRALQPSDIDKLREIHTKFYETEFLFPNFLEKFIGSFVVVDDNENVISGGGVKSIAESIIITNRDYSPHERKSALLQILQASIFVANRNGFEQLHAFVQDDKWHVILKKYGFQDCKGNALFLEV